VERRIDVLEQGIVEAQGPFTAEEVECTDDLAAISVIQAGIDQPQIEYRRSPAMGSLLIPLMMVEKG
jgi:hypothetical protein